LVRKQTLSSKFVNLFVYKSRKRRSENGIQRTAFFAARVAARFVATVAARVAATVAVMFAATVAARTCSKSRSNCCSKICSNSRRNSCKGLQQELLQHLQQQLQQGLQQQLQQELPQQQLNILIHTLISKCINITIRTRSRCLTLKKLWLWKDKKLKESFKEFYRSSWNEFYMGRIDLH
jgi:hypothetical protein